MAKITRINPEGISKPFSNYSHVVTAEGAQKLVFCAGQVAADPDGKVLPPDDFDAQAKMVMANLTKALERMRAVFRTLWAVSAAGSPRQAHVRRCLQDSRPIPEHRSV